ncbi:hypothetical protein SERLA73DRAFT_130648 [Serpula lacrymans var. lacrymans S7.3]|uniref:Uncharacterized protein n=2 Tax=Serpula lacrymans var. lacrymans TaxID=341189 RepID=F8PLB8_SERL3|nr:uncharacterized protein SERLADRAFT_458350 [Serpula lacrymans var. lacrymans S7.9]EGO04026.1 hypothetical protein SERLA73DRAFT_130648 [Serpula lacrymans var. lacrymans S7.3]EGO29943.1 hypothetical protein SERLADRAFT_458350 [Serpula lacrymans var. lacrymans S7.9]
MFRFGTSQDRVECSKDSIERKFGGTQALQQAPGRTKYLYLLDVTQPSTPPKLFLLGRVLRIGE